MDITGQSLSGLGYLVGFLNATITMADLKALPDETTIKEVYDLEVFDINSDKVKFGSICEKAIVVFISMHRFVLGSLYDNDIDDS